jgi:hypothetical protein
MWNWREENDVDVDKNDTVTVPATERDLEREIRAKQQAAAVRGGLSFFVSFIMSALAAVSCCPHT